MHSALPFRARSIVCVCARAYVCTWRAAVWRAAVRLCVQPDTARVQGDVLALAPSTLFYHEKYKHLSRLPTAHKWAKAHHCDARSVRLRCLTRQEGAAAASSAAGRPNRRLYRGCAGAVWERCVLVAAPYTEEGCATAVTRLSGGFSADAQGSDARPSVCARVPAPSAAAGVAAAASRPPPPPPDAASLVPFAASTRRHGTCGVTEFGASDCEDGAQGAWVLRAGSLAECARLCACCARCRYASYSRSDADCSWFAECDFAALHRQGPAGNFHTIQVRK